MPLEKDRPRNWEKVSVSAAAFFLGVSTRTISRMVERGEIKRVTRTSGGHRRFDSSELRKIRRDNRRS